MGYEIITDTHLGHDAIRESCNRPDNFETQILENVEMAAHPNGESILIHLGDVAFYDEAFWHRKLMEAAEGYSKKWLVLGNHDKKSLTWYLKAGWDCVCTALEFKVYGKHVLLTHRPVGIPDYVDINIHGHVHNKDIPSAGPRHKLLCMEHTYAPVSLRSICDSHKI